MDLYNDSIRSHPASERLALVRRIWDDLIDQPDEIELAPEVVSEAIRRRDALLADPDRGLTHEEIWARG